jgi:hypothetical protein
LETGLPGADKLTQLLVAVQLDGPRTASYGSPPANQRREENHRREEVKDSNSSPLTKKR